jgi:predicted nucleic acid-binding protein
MNGKPFFDTNVLIYAALKNDPRSGPAEDLLMAGGVISVQVLNELVSVARRRFQMSWEQVRATSKWIRLLCPAVLAMTVDTHERAVGIAERYGYRIYDSLIIASALEAKCGTLYSEDMQSGQSIEGRLKIRNPFV